MVLSIVSLFLLLLPSVLSASISCLDDTGNPIDWYVVLKDPHGYTYAYADSNTPQLILSSNLLNDGFKNAVGATLQQIYNNDQSDDVAYVQYNDQSPDGKEHETYGHTKGSLAFDKQQGFWLVHSVPKFPAAASDNYIYPHNESIFGQSFLCISLDINTMNTVGNLLLINKPFIYDSNLPSSIASFVPNIQDSINEHWNKDTFNITASLSTLGGSEFIGFAKTKEFNADLYEAFVAPYYDSSLLVETWMDGSDSNKMPSFCSPQYDHDCVNIKEVSLPSGQPFDETSDHSKWAITSSMKGIYCIGDINRQFSQEQRDGGTVCTNNLSMWKSFSAIIISEESC